jgi:ribosome-binding protein aMBF1 (putative translation factor)
VAGLIGNVSLLGRGKAPPRSGVARERSRGSIDDSERSLRLDYSSLDVTSSPAFTAGVARVNPPPAVAWEFGQRIRERRLGAQLSQMQLAERSGLHFTFISSAERGRRNPTLTSILRLAHGLDVDAGSLLLGLREQ